MQDTINNAQTLWSLLPPILALSCALLTRRVLLSLGLGILAGVFLVADFSVIGAAQHLSGTSLGLVWESGGFNLWNLYIVLFLLLLGVMTSVMTLTGATSAFAAWAKQRLTQRKQATLLTAALSFVVFVDDYFHSLAVGSVARPVTDQFKVSRAKLAYLLDSTAAPICVLMPLSSWGAYIIALIGGLLVSHGIYDISPFSAFISLIPLNFYALFALILALIVAYFNLNFGPMASHEQRAMEQNELFDSAKGTPAGAVSLDNEASNGRPLGLVLPIVVLTLTTFTCFVITGAMAIEEGQTFSLLAALEQTDVTLSLVVGGIVGLLTSLAFVILQGIPMRDVLNALRVGLKSMLPAIWILLFAWTIGSVISDLETGKYLAMKLDGNLPPQLLPILLFLLAGGMAFSTGTSWGTFGIMLPIAADMAVATEVAMILPMFAAVLAGAVFGDHCSPISDTTILSSTGAACHHMDHVATQLPYALTAAAASVGSFLVVGYTGNTWLALALGLALLLGLTYAFSRYRSMPIQQQLKA